MTTPKQLAALLKDQCWTTQRLADEIYDVTHVRLSARTLTRFIERENRAGAATQNAIDKFIKARSEATGQEASR